MTVASSPDCEINCAYRPCRNLRLKTATEAWRWFRYGRKYCYRDRIFCNTVASTHTIRSRDIHFRYGGRIKPTRIDIRGGTVVTGHGSLCTWKTNAPPRYRYYNNLSIASWNNDRDTLRVVSLDSWGSGDFNMRKRVRYSRDANKRFEIFISKDFISHEVTHVGKILRLGNFLRCTLFVSTTYLVCFIALVFESFDSIGGGKNSRERGIIPGKLSVTSRSINVVGKWKYFIYR